MCNAPYIWYNYDQCWGEAGMQGGGGTNTTPAQNNNNNNKLLVPPPQKQRAWRLQPRGRLQSQNDMSFMHASKLRRIVGYISCELRVIVQEYSGIIKQSLGNTFLPTLKWLTTQSQPQYHKPCSHEDFNSLPVAYFSIQIRIHLSRWVESGFLQILCDRK